MKIQFLKEDKESAKLKFENEEMTFALALKDELWQTKGADLANVDKRHPLVGKPELMVQGKEPRKLLETAAKNFKKKVEEFEKEIMKQV